MKLAEKGRFAPPPKLERAAQTVSETLASWEGVHARTHWLLGDERKVDGADFYFGEDEVGHIHLDSEAHVFQARKVADAVIAAGLGRPFAWSKDVVVFRVARQRDVDHALWLFRLSYDRRRRVSVDELVARVRTYAGPTLAAR